MVIYNYAYALFEKASENNIINDINEEFSTFIKILQNDEKNTEKWFNLLTRPDISISEKNKLIDELDVFSKLFLSFLKVLVKNGVLIQIERIYAYFINLTKKENKVIMVTATFSRKPTNKAKLELIEHLQKYFNTQSIDVTIAIDRNLLGGYKITYDGDTLDSSFKMQLERLKYSI